jgi:hypothetical protein
VLYKPVAPDAPAAQHARFESPVGSTYIDQVKVLDDTEVAVLTGRDPDGDGYWTLTARIPWAALGVTPPEPGSLLRGDVGILQSDPNGVSTASRLYWSGKSQTVVCDVPSETRLIPALWGELQLAEHDIFGLEEDDSFIHETPAGGLDLPGM